LTETGPGKGFGGNFWPAWLGEEMPQLGVWSLNYAISASAWKGHSLPLVDRANNVLDLFALEDIGQRPLALICHSLGRLAHEAGVAHRQGCAGAIGSRRQVPRSHRLRCFCHVHGATACGSHLTWGAIPK
jgi:hypothetical protein